MKLKSMEELKDGKCKVMTKQGKIFDGTFVSKYPAVFFCIPTKYQVIGYYQDEISLKERIKC